MYVCAYVYVLLFVYLFTIYTPFLLFLIPLFLLLFSINLVLTSSGLIQ